MDHPLAKAHLHQHQHLPTSGPSLPTNQAVHHLSSSQRISSVAPFPEAALLQPTTSHLLLTPSLQAPEWRSPSHGTLQPMDAL